MPQTVAQNLTIQQILGWVYLTGIVEAIKTGIPDVLPPEFYTIKKDTLMDQGRYTRVEGTRQTARRVNYGAPAIQRSLVNIGSYDVKLLHSYEFITLDVKTYQSLRAYDNYNVQNMGMQEIDRQALQFRAYFDNLEKACLYSMLGSGQIYFDSSGNLLPTSSGAALTVDYGLSSAHQNQLNGIISASWASPTTDIPTQIRYIQKQSAKDTGYVLENGFYGINIPSYFAVNSFAQPFLARSPVMREKFLDTGEIPDGLFGVRKWVPVYTAFYSDANGNQQEFFNVDGITFTPAVDSVWYEMMVGTYPVPTSFQPMANLQAAVNSFEIVQGLFSYGIPVHNPMTAEVFYGHTFLPVCKFPDAMYIADTTP
ncbi:MAG: hypothetical protein KGL39_07895 [Patescibacteria group bacterium]|nr:hypothetical protein [Patescibacteria group bacterium]